MIKVLAREAERKGDGSRSRWTGRSVTESYEKMTIEVPFARGAKFTFNMTGLPKIGEERMFELALLQVRAFFYWITYDRTSRRGGFWIGPLYREYLARAVRAHSRIGLSLGSRETLIRRCWRDDGRVAA
jgi:hypothetical protein